MEHPNNSDWNILFHERTRAEIGQCAVNTTAVLPVAAIEQHGPHLPVLTDSAIVEAVAQAAARIASRDIPILVCPVVAYGASQHHLIYPGTVSLSTGTLIQALKELTDSLAESGFKRIFLLNGHGGNEECIRLAARELALRRPVIAGAASYWTIAWGHLEKAKEAAALGFLPGHAGGFETSLMMALRPELVKTELLPLEGHHNWPVAKPADPASGTLIQRNGSWAAIDGYSDDAGTASAESGRILLDIISKAVAAEWIAFHRRLP
jgi:creatinine amidohydrolase